MCLGLYLAGITGKAVAVGWPGWAARQEVLELGGQQGAGSALPGLLLAPRPWCSHAWGERIDVRLDVKQACVLFNFGGCLGRMSLQDFLWVDTNDVYGPVIVPLCTL